MSTDLKSMDQPGKGPLAQEPLLKRPCRYRLPEQKTQDVLKLPKPFTTSKVLPPKVISSDEKQIEATQESSEEKKELSEHTNLANGFEPHVAEDVTLKSGSEPELEHETDSELEEDLKLELEPEIEEEEGDDASENSQSRMSRESLSIEVTDEFVTDEFSPSELASQSEDETGSSLAEVEILTHTKSGRKVLKPVPLNVGLDSGRSTRSSVTSVDSEEEESLVEPILTEEGKKELEESIPCLFQPGDLVWARLGIAPYWACGVTEDPDEKVHTRVNLRGKKGIREYHVQFFGRTQRAWVKDSCIFKFEGLKSFQEKSEQAKKMKSSAQKKHLKAFVPSNSCKAHWNDALNQMLEIADLNNENRIQIMHRLFDEAKQQRLVQKVGEKRKHSLSSSSKASEDGAAKKPKLFQEAEDLIKAIPAEVLEENRRKLKSGFKLFKLAHMNKLKNNFKNHIEMDRKLTRMWNAVTRNERQYYCDESFKLSKLDDGIEENLKNGQEAEIADSHQLSEEDLDKSASEVPSSSASSVIVENPKSSKTKASGNASFMIGLWKKESCCIICEETNQTDLLRCRGNCQNSYHMSCLKLEEKPNIDTWKCEACTTGVFPCMICKSTEGERVRCCVPTCGKFYHLSCLKTGLWPQARFNKTQLTCPAHMCHTCASDDPADPVMKYSSPLLRCIRCPTSYHSGDHCITAGSIQLTASQIVCPKHYSPPKSKKGASTHINTSWCFICSAGGTLYCCELCPASFHAECLKIDPPEGHFFCNSCESGQMPLYGEVLWVKLGNYRWWPARVLHPCEVPDNIERLPHDIGEFPIQFCGTKEYFWMNRGRCFPYQEGDSDKIPGMSGTSSSSLEVSFRRGLAEAAERYEAYTSTKNQREAALAEKVRNQSHLKPPMFTKIKSNKPYGDCPVYNPNPLDQQVCDCDPKSEHPCGRDSECINRYLMVECTPSNCLAGDRCGNMQFQRRSYPKLTVNRTATRGWGLYIREDVKKGDFLIEYVGELITMEEFKKRMAAMLNSKDGEQNYYFMVMDNSRVIDAGPRGNIARFMNHSCSPNCETQKWTVNGDTRIGLFALEDIKGGTELTFNYQLEAFGEVKKPCLCGAKNCSGFIGEKPSKIKNRSSSMNKPVNSVNKKKRLKSLKPQVKKVWEDHCFRCFHDGEVILCDFKNCPKVYHLNCVEQEKLPRGEWFCPWHFCVVCARAASQNCLHCPNAYCKNHASALGNHPILKTICDEHKDDIGDILKFYTALGDGIDRIIQNPNAVLEAESKGNRNKIQPVVDLPSPPVVEKLPTPTMKPKVEAVTPVVVSRHSERLFECPGCGREMRASLIRRHIQAKHNDLYVRAGLSTDGEDLANRLAALTNDLKNGEVVEDSNVITDKISSADVSLENISNSSLNMTPASEACVLCAAPGCNKYIHHSNMARHWKCWHPNLNKADYVKKRLSSSSSPKKSGQSPSPAKPTENDKINESLTHSTDMVVQAGVTQPMVNGQYICRYSGCDYMTKYNSNMWRHRRKYKHILDEMLLSKYSKVEVEEEEVVSDSLGVPVYKNGSLVEEIKEEVMENEASSSPAKIPEKTEKDLITDEKKSQLKINAETAKIGETLGDQNKSLSKKLTNKITSYFLPKSVDTKSSSENVAPKLGTE